MAAQEQRLRSYVASQPDWRPVGTFTDQPSGASTERGPRAALRPAARLTGRPVRRSVRGLETLLEALDATGVAFRSATKQSGGKRSIQRRRPPHWAHHNALANRGAIARQSGAAMSH